MSQQSKNTLQTAINTQIADNTSGNITAANVRNNLINITDSLVFNTGSQAITGSLTVTGGITGSLLGTASFATNTTLPFNAFRYNINVVFGPSVPSSGNCDIYLSEGENQGIFISKTTSNGINLSNYLTSRLNNTSIMINIPGLSPQNAIIILTTSTDNGSYLTFDTQRDNVGLYGINGQGTITFIP
jgi:hypothetical protein